MCQKKSPEPLHPSTDVSNASAETNQKPRTASRIERKYEQRDQIEEGWMDLKFLSTLLA